ncbi:hypothetical protein FKP32DRAFT_131155 [Trametes sanguinea]|nr:hypothetical protein FKP32DRAFT_131155 [Trametes sanguinea]
MASHSNPEMHSGASARPAESQGRPPQPSPGTSPHAHTTTSSSHPPRLVATTISLELTRRTGRPLVFVVCVACMECRVGCVWCRRRAGGGSSGCATIALHIARHIRSRSARPHSASSLPPAIVALLPPTPPFRVSCPSGALFVFINAQLRPCLCPPCPPRRWASRGISCQARMATITRTSVRTPELDRPRTPDSTPSQPCI